MYFSFLDYCWRDYDGKIPSDALPAGMDKDGKQLYIGQVLYENKIIAGKIREGDNKIYIEYFSVEYSSSENVKVICVICNLWFSFNNIFTLQIFCTKSPSKFEWIPTRNTEVLNLLPGKTLIKGGFEPSCTMYLGRLKTYDSLNVGKVMCCQQNSCYGIYTTNDGKGRLDDVFQILSYNKDNSGSFNFPEIGTRYNVTPTQSTTSRSPKSCKLITINLFT